MTAGFPQSDTSFALDPKGPLPSPTVRSERVQKGSRIFERYMQRQSGRELFRVCVGDQESILWRFGITAEGDFNGDGRIDYAWYGGDDTASMHFLFLSCDGGYCAFDLTSSLAAAYERKFRGRALDLAANDYSTTRLTIQRSQEGLIVSAYITGLSAKPLRIEAESKLWVRLKAPDAAYFPAHFPTGQATP